MLESLQNILAQALYHPDSQQNLTELMLSADLTQEERNLLSRAQPRGLKLTHLLLMNLRFERVLRGCPALEDWFESDPKGFVDIFRKYNMSSPPETLFAVQEGKVFLDFLERNHPDYLPVRKNKSEP